MSCIPKVAINFGNVLTFATVCGLLSQLIGVARIPSQAVGGNICKLPLNLRRLFRFLVIDLGRR